MDQKIAQRWLPTASNNTLLRITQASNISWALYSIFPNNTRAENLTKQFFVLYHLQAVVMIHSWAWREDQRLSPLLHGSQINCEIDKIYFKIEGLNGVAE